MITNQQVHLSGAAYAIRVFGGVRATARLVGRDPSIICRWQRPREVGGQGGLVPAAMQRELLRLAAARGLPLTADDLVNGRTVDVA